jgi:hypothetical protein
LSLRIGFDLDGVLADMNAELRRQADILFGDGLRRRAAAGGTPDAAVPPVDAGAPPNEESVGPALGLDLTPRQASRLWRHVESIDGFWESLKEIEPGAIARLDALAAERRWEVIFLTKRPESAGATAQVQSQRWLQANGFVLPSVYVVQASRGRIASALGLDVVVDDRPENCFDVVADSAARAVLVWRGENKDVPAAAGRLGIVVVRSVGDCLDVLAGGGRERSGILDRLKRLLGMKASSTTPSDPPAAPPRSRTPTLS